MLTQPIVRAARCKTKEWERLADMFVVEKNRNHNYLLFSGVTLEDCRVERHEIVWLVSVPTVLLIQRGVALTLFSYEMTIEQELQKEVTWSTVAVTRDRITQDGLSVEPGLKLFHPSLYGLCCKSLNYANKPNVAYNWRINPLGLLLATGVGPVLYYWLKSLHHRHLT